MFVIDASATLAVCFEGEADERLRQAALRAGVEPAA